MRRLVVGSRVTLTLFAGVGAAFGALGCDGDARPRGAPAAAAHANETAQPLLGSREDAVALSTRLAAEANHAASAQKPQLFGTAAELRERLYRREHRQVDALEAVELFRSLEKSPSAACSAALKRVQLEAELRKDPAWLYQQIYGIRGASNDVECRSRADTALLALGGYRPLSSVLEEIDSSRAARDDPSAAAVSSAQHVIAPALVPNGSAPAKIERIERYGAKDAARVVVFLSRPTRYEVGQLGEATGVPRLFVDIDAATYTGAPSFEVGGLVQRVRIGRSARGSRIVLDVTGPVHPRVFYLPEPFRLVIDVLAEGAASTDARRPVRRVALDPGHGGHDPGAIGPGGLREKDVALDVAHRAAPILARELGIATLLTRDGDDYVALDERTARANAFHADLFISIHCNASEDTAAKGVMTFVLDKSRERVAERIAARENAASAEASVELANALSRLNDPSSVQSSLQLAELLQRAAVASLLPGYPEIPNGGVKRAGFYVLAGARMPAVLFETSFISSSAGEARLNTADFRQKLADAIVNAVRAFRDGR